MSCDKSFILKEIHAAFAQHFGMEVVFSSSQELSPAAKVKDVAGGTSFVSWAGLAAESLFASLFPSDCRLCGAPLIKISRLPVCEDCLQAMRPIAGGVCSTCGEGLVSLTAFSGDHNEPLCGLCRRMAPPFAKAAAYGSYHGGLRELIHLLKYEHLRTASHVLGRMLAEVIAGLRPAFGDAPLLVVPVPLHRSKMRQRGFNQADLIACAALKLKPAGDQLTFNGSVLERRRDTESQTGRSSHQRRENIRGAFAVAMPKEVEGREILLVDDVFTTGTTVSECARILRRAGATRVWIATVARTLKTNTQYAVPNQDDETQLAMAAHG